MHHNIFDGMFNGMAQIEMYRAWVLPELSPEQPRARLENWPEEDLIAYVGGSYAKGVK